MVNIGLYRLKTVNIGCGRATWRRMKN